MEDDFNEVDMERLRGHIQGYVQAVLSNAFSSQVADQHALTLEFLTSVGEFHEQKKECKGNQIAKDEHNYREILQKYETLQREVKEHQASIFENMKQMFDEMFKRLNKMHQLQMKRYGKAHDDVQKALLQKFERLHEKQQEELAEFKKKIVSMLM